MKMTIEINVHDDESGKHWYLHDGGEWWTFGDLDHLISWLRVYLVKRTS